MPRRDNAKPFNVVEIFNHSVPNATDRRNRRHSGSYPDLRLAANRARNAVAEALLKKRIDRPLDCSRCGRHAPGRIAANHADYTRRLEVTWLCLSCTRYAWQAREDACAVAIATGGNYVNGVWVAPAGVRDPAKEWKTLQPYSRKRRGTTREEPAIQRFIAADLERYLSGQPSRIGEVLAGKGAAVVVKDSK